LKASMEKELHELRNELAEVRVKAMDMLRARGLRKFSLRP
jgi:ribosomal protein L29